jgi:hypothetical protein
VDGHGNGWFDLGKGNFEGLVVGIGLKLYFGMYKLGRNELGWLGWIGDVVGFIVSLFVVNRVDKVLFDNELLRFFLMLLFSVLIWVLRRFIT